MNSYFTPVFGGRGYYYSFRHLGWENTKLTKRTDVNIIPHWYTNQQIFIKVVLVMRDPFLPIKVSLPSSSLERFQWRRWGTSEVLFNLLTGVILNCDTFHRYVMEICLANVNLNFRFLLWDGRRYQSSNWISLSWPNVESIFNRMTVSRCPENFPSDESNWSFMFS